MLTGLLGGLRWGESTALCKADIDWKRGRIHVQRSFSDKTSRTEAPKSGKDRRRPSCWRRSGSTWRRPS